MWSPWVTPPAGIWGCGPPRGATFPRQARSGARIRSASIRWWRSASSATCTTIRRWSRAAVAATRWRNWWDRRQPTHPNVYADTSPDLLEPSPAREILIHGSVDPIAPAKAGEDYRASAEKHGGKPELMVIPDANHFDLITPETDAWKKIRAVIFEALHLKQPS